MALRSLIITFVCIGLYGCGTAKVVNKKRILELRNAPTGGGLSDARTLASKGDIAGAIHLTEAHIIKHPNDPSGHYTLGTLLGTTGEWEDAQVALNRCLALNNKHGAAYVNLGIASLALKDTKNALVAFRRATQLMPNVPEPWFNLAIAQTKNRNHSAAVKAYETALLKAPASIETQLGLAEALNRLGRRADALTRYEKLLSKHPDNVDGLVGLSTTLRQMGQYADAIKNANKATKLAPKNPSGWLSLALAHDLQGKSSKLAEPFYKKALGLNANHLPTLFNYGMFLEQQKRTEEAITFYQRYLKVPSDNSRAVKAVTLRLKRLTKPQQKQ